MILAWEATDRAGSAAMVAADGNVIESQVFEPGRAAAELPAALDRLLRAHGQPESLAVATGPGSFTGLRVAVVAARTLGWTEALPVRPVDSLRAIAAAAGLGRWWVWLPLKKDTTFQASFEVQADNITQLTPMTAQLDSEPPTVPEGVTIIGPALATKPHLSKAWASEVPVGSDAACRAIGVASAARWVDAVPWDEVDVAYHMASAPELQRAAREQTS